MGTKPDKNESDKEDILDELDDLFWITNTGIYQTTNM